ncbi:hypothetical protein LXA43DRAFT_1101220 [Ganoderma leucocontextum]|nr:hypothetical protein LXA43DRAFT_1101220 [Ganoderma leucocontextum]
MAQLQLNFDVLREICGFLTDVPDVLSFSLTCSTLRPFAIERRLRMRAIAIDTEESIRNLHNFLFVDEKRRGPHIHTLTIPVCSISPGPSEELVDRLLAVFASATRLRTLSLHVPPTDTNGPASLFSDPRILAAVIQMTNLQELGVVTTVDIAHHLLGSTRSVLKSFRYGEPRHGDEPPSQSIFITIAPHLTPALEDLEFPFQFFIMAYQSYISFPAARILTLTSVFETFRLDMLLAVCPNLDRTLIIEDILYEFDDDHLETLRKENREVQETRAWKGLIRVAASPTMLFALGLTCPIHHLTIDFMPEVNPGGPEALPNSTRAILHDCTPTHLALANIKLSPGFPGPILDGSLLPEKAVSKLTHLIVHVEYVNSKIEYGQPVAAHSEERVDPSWDAVLDSLLVGLQSLRLTHVHISIGCNVDGQHGPFSAAIYDGLRSFKFGRLVSTLVRTLPSLTHIFITSFGSLYNGTSSEKEEETWDASRAWRVRRKGGVTPAGDMAEMDDSDLEELNAELIEVEIYWEQMDATEISEWITYVELPTASPDSEL